MEQSNALFNKNVYNLTKVVNYYKLSTLQPAESAFFSLIKGQLNNMRMLDIGVGGGRTTHHFGPIAKEYIGIDYADKMVEACKKTFNDSQGNMSFKVCDARDLSQFGDEEFDIILFSFNGIDHCTLSERKQIFEEIQRVGKKGAWFCFSSSNIQWFSSWSSIGFTADPIRLLARIRHYFLLRYYNPGFKNRLMENVGIFISSAHNYNLKLNFIRPSYQLQCLKELGFENPRAYMHDTGVFSDDMDRLNQLQSNWIYYLTRM